MILVTGATGLVGGHLLYRFRESGKNIIATYRSLENIDLTREIFESYKKGAGIQVDDFTWVQADILDLPSLERAVRGVTHIYHCAAALEGMDFDGLKDVNMRGTENLVNVALAHQVEKFCHVSSIAALGDPIGQAAITEEDYFNLDAQNSDYAITKFGAEMEVWRATQEGLEVVILNPGVVLGEGNWKRGSGKLFSKTYRGNLFYTKGGSGFVDVRDLTKCMQLLMEGPTVNERYIVVAQNCEYQKILSTIAHSLKVKSPRISVARWVLQLLSLCYKFLGLFGLKSELSRASIASLYSQTKYDNTKVKEALDFQFTPVAESISRISQFYLSRKN